ncbi:MAG: hypothetical protein GTO30_15370 [Acidobacteria bacterium]|nr:hypothetical protein [Acidobacteriota bacterium]NIO57893.1 hypothetical protein [Acidobacteriota bacterium]NIQ86112.1 hypothetical protein [Acidobacteriota bacterium]
MKPRAGKGLLLLLAATLVVVSTGCPNSTVITAGNGTVRMSVITPNPTRFTFGSFDIDRILIRPVDAGASQAIGAQFTGKELSLLRTFLFVNVSEPMVDPSFLRPVPLSEGDYEIIEIRYSDMQFGDPTNPWVPPDPTTCEGAQRFYFPPGEITVDSFAVPQIFTVSNAQETSLTLTFDIEKMITALNNSYDCVMVGGTYQQQNPSTWDESQFIAQTLDYLTIN